MLKQTQHEHALSHQALDPCPQQPCTAQHLDGSSSPKTRLRRRAISLPITPCTLDQHDDHLSSLINLKYHLHALLSQPPHIQSTATAALFSTPLDHLPDYPIPSNDCSDEDCFANQVLLTPFPTTSSLRTESTPTSPQLQPTLTQHTTAPILTLALQHTLLSQSLTIFTSPSSTSHTTLPTIAHHHLLIYANLSTALSTHLRRIHNAQARHRRLIQSSHQKRTVLRARLADDGADDHDDLPPATEDLVGAGRAEDGCEREREHEHEYEHDLAFQGHSRAENVCNATFQRGQSTATTPEAKALCMGLDPARAETQYSDVPERQEGRGRYHAGDHDGKKAMFFSRWGHRRGLSVGGGPGRQQQRPQQMIGSKQGRGKEARERAALQRATRAEEVGRNAEVQSGGWWTREGRARRVSEDLRVVWNSDKRNWAEDELGAVHLEPLATTPSWMMMVQCVPLEEMAASAEWWCGEEEPGAAGWRPGWEWESAYRQGPDTEGAAHALDPRDDEVSDRRCSTERKHVGTSRHGEAVKAEMEAQVDRLWKMERNRRKNFRRRRPVT